MKRRSKTFILILAALMFASCGQNVREDSSASKQPEEIAAEGQVQLDAAQNKAGMVLVLELPKNVGEGQQIAIVNKETGSLDFYQGKDNKWVLIESVEHKETVINKGVKGSEFHLSNGVPTSKLGVDGDKALNELTGDIFIKADGEWIFRTNLHGRNAKDGTQIYNVVATPEENLGVENDLAINSLNGDYFQKLDGQWEKIANLKGPKGEQGETGAKGEQGEAGARGEQGEAGARGEQGEAGAKGEQGETGARGEQGEAGARGVTERTEIVDVIAESLSTAELKDALNDGLVLPFRNLSETKKSENDPFIDTLLREEKNHKIDGKNVVKDGQVVFTYILPEELLDDNVEIISTKLSIDVTKNSFDTTPRSEQLCMSTKMIKKCSGQTFSAKWATVKNPKFYSTFKKAVNSKFIKDVLGKKRVLKSRHSLVKTYDLAQLLEFKSGRVQEMRLNGEKHLTVIFTDDITVNKAPELKIRFKRTIQE